MWWIATFCVLLWLDFSINILTLLALVLAIGLVVDDAIVVLENVHRRMVEYGETRLVAAFRGTRQVGFAVVATSVVLIAVFVPIAFLQGSVGRLFSEFALTMAAAVGFSTLVALTLSPMMASRILPQGHRPGPLSRAVDHAFGRLCRVYLASLNLVLHHRWVMVLVFLGTMGSAVWLYREVPQEYTPKEDRGTFNILVDGPEGASFSYMREYLDEIERRLMPYIERGEALRLQVRAPRSFTAQIFNSGQATLVLNDYDRRRSAWAIMEEVRQSLADLPGIRTTPVMRRGFGSRTQKPVQFVLGGGTYAELAQWRDRLLAEIDQSNPGLSGIDWDYKETKPQLRVAIDYERAADLGVKVGTIGRTLETMLSSRRVTTYLDAGEEYDVILEGERDAQRTPASLDNLYVRSERSKALIPLANLVKVSELADSKSLNRFDRLRAITIEANLAEGLALGEALGYLEGLVHQHLPDQVQIGYKGQSKDFQQASGDILFVFALGLVVVFLVLAAHNSRAGCTPSSSCSRSRSPCPAPSSASGSPARP